ncbi:hypothetical protein BROUX41_002789 [Berkeleyomyces rouxiae]|uniref:uncharacterized protein n=1 Tax=Berkeleyomyces rouxiae TaxID=2035830 RepID=UPI003B802494
MDRQPQKLTPGLVRAPDDRARSQMPVQAQNTSPSQSNLDLYSKVGPTNPGAQALSSQATPVSNNAMSYNSRLAGASQQREQLQLVAQTYNANAPQRSPLFPRVDPADAIGVAISQPIPIQNPIQAQQWPLPQASVAPSSYKPPAGRSQPPPRPVRTGKLVSMVGNNQPQLQVPASTYESSHRQIYNQETNQPEPYEINFLHTPSSRPSISSVGSIPDFPVPAPQTPSEFQPVFSKRATLGPPPSSRRGASSFYSTLSYVEPIPEETSQTIRSHTSFASSAAIPDDFDTDGMPSSDFMSDDDEYSPFEQQVFDDRPDFMRTRPNTGNSSSENITFNMLKPPPAANPFMMTEASSVSPRAGPISNPFLGVDEFEGDLAESISPRRYAAASPGLSPGNSNQQSPQAVTPERIQRAVMAATHIDSNSPTTERQYSRLSAMRRPPKLNIDAANNRTSTTSLPDMIRRATRLAYMIDKGKRPGSKAEAVEFDFGQAAQGGKFNVNGRQSGLSDMLAAFPPPANPGSTPTSAQPGRIRSFLRSPNSWPFPPNRSPGMQALKSPLATSATGTTEKTYSNPKARRCCGLPLWGFVLLILFILALSAAAIVIPLRRLVLKDNPKSTPAAAESGTDQCLTRLPCLNGGTSVILNGECSCICVNGFTGDNCGIAGAVGCTITNLVTPQNTTDTINNVTLGLAIPRLIVESQDSYSVSLSGSQILSRFNSANLSCVAQNSLVTFDGSATRLDETDLDVSAERVTNNAAIAESYDGATTTAAPSTTMPPTTTTVTLTSTVTVDPPTATAIYDTSQDSIDFARVAVLFILQETDLSQASAAQASLERFFTTNTNATEQEAKSVDLGNSNFIDLVNFRVQAGNSVAGSGSTTAGNKSTDS